MALPNSPINVTLATGLNKDDDAVTAHVAGVNLTEVDLATDADVTVSAVPAILHGIYANVVFSAHAVNLLDGATTKIILPASTAAGTEKDFHGAKFTTSLIVNSDDAATGKVVLFWSVL